MKFIIFLSAICNGILTYVLGTVGLYYFFGEKLPTIPDTYNIFQAYWELITSNLLIFSFFVFISSYINAVAYYKLAINLYEKYKQ